MAQGQAVTLVYNQHAITRQRKADVLGGVASISD